MVSVDAVHLILTEDLLPTIRAAVADLGGDGPDTLVHTRPTPAGSGWPTNSAAALVHHVCGVLTSWGAACLGGEDIVRDRDAEFAFTGPVGPDLDRLGALIDRLPGWVTAAVGRGDLATPAGTTVDVDAARRAGTFTPEWVVGHILHEVAAHTGQLQVTRDVLLSRGRSR
ncbi:mycothiol transferase [Dietzia cinnamea]|uniref:mycothiol transferase n=1 Tax=Dietzia cinnamea TaxID=321318 RepID=UPI0013EA129C|nr:DUF664 domain-containing protein [Dietzia cinnamea]MCT1713072.1 DUF664 domain-containing protein [Dietzia cinnamea]MCT2263141.1 DUF664 domain-containing protein [Dietzia cinnamea]MCT2273921.1 DUF664 domain-containing protein [Dietzia cinnamea]